MIQMKTRRCDIRKGDLLGEVRQKKHCRARPAFFYIDASGERFHLCRKCSVKMPKIIVDILQRIN